MHPIPPKQPFSKMYGSNRKLVRGDMQIRFPARENLSSLVAGYLTVLRLQNSMRKVCTHLPLLLILLAPLHSALAALEANENNQHTQKQASLRLPTPITHVNDLAGVVDEKTKQRLENTLKNLKRRARIEFKLATVETTAGHDIFDFSRQLARDWDVGSRNNAKKTLLLVLAVKERTLFIQFSRAAQTELPEGILGEVRQRMLESVGTGRFSEGLMNGIQHFVNTLAQKIGFSLQGIDQPDPAITFVATSSAPKQKQEGTPVSEPKGISSPGVSVEPRRIVPLVETSSNANELISEEAPREEDTSPTSRAASLEKAGLNEIYRVGAGDVLTIGASNSTTGRSTLYTVDDAGQIDFGPAGGPIAVAGLTTMEIQARLASERKPLEVKQGAQLTVGVRQYASHAVTVTGLVNNPGTKFLKREVVPLYVIIAEAQPRVGAGQVTVVRAGQTGPALDLYDPAALNFNVQPGDVINVTSPTEEFYYIGGRINRPGQKTFQPGITVLQAILAAGGVNSHSDHEINLLREGSDGRLTTTTFNLRQIKAGKVQDPRLQSGDRIEVAP
jgi:protein involved in polysaccharide export with SLBB domain